MNATRLINIGNTHTQLASVENGEICSISVVATEAFVTDSVDCGVIPDDIAVIASVVPEATKVVTEFLKTPHIITAESTNLINFSEVDTSTLGADRIANAVGAAAYGSLPVIVVDCGTAITIEVVDNDRRFKGGLILPGRQLSRNALRSGTAQLPGIPLSETLPELLARHTADAIAGGIDHTLIKGLKGVIDELADTLNGSPSYIATGGDAEFFIHHISTLKPAPDNLTLLGLLAISKAI